MYSKYSILRIPIIKVLNYKIIENNLVIYLIKTLLFFYCRLKLYLVYVCAYSLQLRTVFRKRKQLLFVSLLLGYIMLFFLTRV